MIPGKGMPCFPVFEDNQGALQLSKNPVSNSISKHINVRHHFLKELVRQGDIIVNHVPSEYQHADVLTKVLISVINEVVIWWISKLMYVCLYEFSSVDTAGGLYQLQ